MFTIRRTAEFDAWFESIQDVATRVRLARRLERATRGTLGDVSSVGHGVHEMREHFGPGWRMYFVQRGDTLILMLGGGTKRGQQRDIQRAIALASRLED